MLETSLCGDVERKLTAMTTIIYTVSQELSEVEETSGKKQSTPQPKQTPTADEEDSTTT